MTVTLGDHSYAADITCHCDLVVGRYSSIASGLRIVSGQHPPVAHHRAVTSYPLAEQLGADYWPCKMDGRVEIGHDVWIGEAVAILDGVKIGNGAIVAACSVVVRDVAPFEKVAGNPAASKGYRFTPTEIEALERIAWWDWTTAQVIAAAKSMRHVVPFLESHA